MEKKILILYLHEEFVDKLLCRLYPDNFKKGEKIPKTNIEIFVTSENRSDKINFLLGLNQGYECMCANEVYIESCLVIEDTEPLVKKLKEKASVNIVKLREL